METIKTAVVVTCLLGVLYGVYTILNKPAPQTPPEVAAAWDAGDISTDLNIEIPDGGYSEDGLGFAPGPPTPMADGGNGTDGGFNGYQDTPPPLEFAPAPPAPNVPGEGFDPGPGSDNFPPQFGASPPPYETSPPPEAFPALNNFAPDSRGADLPSPPSPDATFPPDATPAPLAPNLGPPTGVPELDPNTGGFSPQDALVETPDASAPVRPFERARRSALAQIEAGELRQALFTLSLFYNDSDMTEEEHRQLLELLDPLAGRVIYSREHLLSSAHVTQQGESLASIAAQYQVPEQLLININGIQRPEALTSGTELKVVPGPFQAEVDLTRGELTLFLQRLYAGRFPISVGNDPTPREGDFVVKDKKQGQTYYSPTGAIAADDPANPYGRYWIDLGEQSVHGSAQTPSSLSTGCISLSPGDAQDAFNILTVGSKVKVVR